MEKFRDALNVLRIIFIVCTVIALIMDVAVIVYLSGLGLVQALAAFFGTIMQLLGLIFGIWFMGIKIDFVNETIQLRDDFENHKKTSKPSPKKSYESTGERYDYGSNAYKMMAKYTKILPSSYEEENGKGRIMVDGKYTSRDDVGVKCPVCSTISPARKSSCQGCGLDYYFK